MTAAELLERSRGNVRPPAPACVFCSKAASGWLPGLPLLFCLPHLVHALAIVASDDPTHRGALA